MQPRSGGTPCAAPGCRRCSRGGVWSSGTVLASAVLIHLCRPHESKMTRTLFLQAPSYDGFDGGAGSRYQARREIRSFWYPTWLAQTAALVPDSKLIDAAPHGITLSDVVV